MKNYLNFETDIKKLEEIIKYYVRLCISIKNSNALNDFYNSRKPENTIMSLGVDATHSFFKQNKYLDPFKEIIGILNLLANSISLIVFLYPSGLIIPKL